MKPTPNTDTARAFEHVRITCAVLADHKESKAVAAVSDWLDALTVQYQAMMSEIRNNPEALTTMQLKLRQIVALRKAVADPEASTGALFD